MQLPTIPRPITSNLPRSQIKNPLVHLFCPLFHLLSLPCTPMQVAAAKKPRLPMCQYGKQCYRKNPVHFQEYAHPGDYDSEDDKTEEDSEPPTPPPPSRSSRTTRGRAVKGKKPAKTKKRRGDETESDDYDSDDSFINDESESD
eukprot:Colp12_sorted_trinity150504_noHs@917